MPELNEEQQKDVSDRVKKFLDRYKALIDEVQVDFITYPIFTANDQGTFDVRVQTQPVDRKYMPVKSFIQP